jgi:cold shock CspA family protein
MAVAPMAVTDNTWPPVNGTLTKIRKGMAFCSVEGISDDVLLGEKSLVDSGIDLATLKEGDSLTFAMAKGHKGYHATNIQRNVNQENWQMGRPVNHENWQMGRRSGTLKKTHGGMGFCHVEGIDGDVLLGPKAMDLSGIDVTTLVVGDALTFDVSIGPKGYHATNIQRAVNAWHGQAGQGQRVSGTLKKIGDGMGFCSVEGIAGDVLLGGRSLMDSGVDLSTMQLGDALFFDMNAGPRGYHASNIQPVGCRVTGTLKKIGDGMGFCSVKGIAGDVLLGTRSLMDSGVDLGTMQLGDALTFQMAAGPRGYHATDIQQAVDAQPVKMEQQAANVGQRATGRLKTFTKQWDSALLKASMATFSWEKGA